MKPQPPDWTHDESTRSALQHHLDTSGLTQAQLAKKLGVGTTRLCKYLNLDKPDSHPESDASRVEQVGKAFLRHLGRRSAIRDSLFENNISNNIAGVLRQIRRTGDVGCIYGPAGIGKTCGADLFCNDNPNTLFITATRYRRSAADVERMLADELADEPRPAGQRRAIWMENLLRGTERMIIVDNAHKLAYSGLEFLFDFHDSTLCAIALIGNPEVIFSLRKSDQLFSRIGIKFAVRPPAKNEEFAPTAATLIKQIAPDSFDSLRDEAAEVIQGMGHCRTLKKQLLLARELRETGKEKDWLKTFETAGKMLIKN